MLEAIVQLATCEDPTAGLGGAGRGLARGASSLSFKGDSASGVRGGVVYPDFMTLEEGADSWQAAVLPSSGGDDRESSLVGAALASLWRRGSRRLGRLSRSLRRSRGDVREEAAAMGIHPGMLAAVEPIYSMSGPTAASLSVRCRRSGRAGLLGRACKRSCARLWAAASHAACCRACWHPLTAPPFLPCLPQPLSQPAGRARSHAFHVVGG